MLVVTLGRRVGQVDYPQKLAHTLSRPRTNYFSVRRASGKSILSEGWREDFKAGARLRRCGLLRAPLPILMTEDWVI